MHFCQQLFVQNEVMQKEAEKEKAEGVPVQNPAKQTNAPEISAVQGTAPEKTESARGELEGRLHRENLAYRSGLKNRKRIVVKIGSSSLLHKETGRLDYHRIDHLAEELADLKNQGKEVILVSSGATAAGREALGEDRGILASDAGRMSRKQACASIGQARLIMIYQKFFEEYNQLTGQVLMTKTTIVNPTSRENLEGTIEELLDLGVIPIVNENDVVATLEYKLGDNDSLSAMVASILKADLLILLSDVDGLYTDDPRSNLDARFIEYVPELTEEIMSMGKETTGSGVGTGGMNTKLHAARMATASGCDMLIVNTKNGVGVIADVVNGENVGTLFCANEDPAFDLIEYVEETY